MSLPIIICTIAILVLVTFILFIVYQMSSFRRSYTLKENKPISKMNKKDIILALQAEELNSHRWTEDILELLIKKELLTLEELPVTVQTRLLYKKELRQRLTEITTVNN